MSYRRPHSGHPNHERWLVSYADFITLLFAFFVVMFASSRADRGRAQQVAESVRRALEESYITARVAAMLAGSQGKESKIDALPDQPAKKPPQDLHARALRNSPDLALSFVYLSRALAEEIKSGKMRIRIEPRGLIISLSQAAFFPSGEDTIDPSMYPSIEKVAKVLRDLPNPVHLEGHTDSVPIHNSRFRSNWDLSAARSVAMLELLTRHFGIEPDRLAIAGYASNVPVDSNQTEQGRARNRRVDIVILNRTMSLVEGSATSPDTSAANPASKPGGAPATKVHDQ